MKKIGLLTAALALILFTGYNTSAQSTTSPTDKMIKEPTSETFAKRSYTDKNSDGVCDNYSARSKANKGHNFVDANKDGVCDNHNSKGKAHRKGNGNGKGHGNHKHGRSYGNTN